MKPAESNIIKRITARLKAVSYTCGVISRRVKFAFFGFIHNPPKIKTVLLKAASALKEAAKNPIKYVPVLKAGAFCMASAAYLAGMMFIGAALSGTGAAAERNTGDEIGGGFVLDSRESAVHLSWKDGVVELSDGEARVKLSASITPKFLERAGIIWTSSDESIAKVSPDGRVTAKKAGVVYISAALRSGQSASAKLTVLQPVEELFMETSNVTLYAGGTGQYLRVRTFPEDAVDTELVWESKDESIVSVNSSGHIKPVGIGMTEIIAKTKDGELSCKSFVTVINYTVKVDSVSIENENTELEIGEVINLVASVLPYNARNKTLTWRSSDDNIVTVNQTGRIKGISAGTAAISAESVNGVKAAVIVNVKEGEVKNGFDLNDDYSSTAVSLAGGTTYTAYGISLPMMAQIQMGLSPVPQIWRNGGSVAATEAEVIEYINPANYSDGAYKYQFLDLSRTNGVSEEALNMYLADKGVLAGHGGDFKAAAEQYGVSEVYLIAHACLETGNGSSQLARGVDVNGVTVYNVFGIGAYDSGAVTHGSQKAYNEGWTSVEAAIRGGAQWISRYYINNPEGRQNTLYKMLWNPDNPGTHQYATDIGWAVKQAQNMERILGSFAGAALAFDVPVYSGQTAPQL